MVMLNDDNQSTRAGLLRLTPSGDLLDLAREMRDMGVESLLFCASSGRIERVVTDRQIAHLAAHPEPVSAGTVPISADPAGTAAEIPSQVSPARADVGVPAAGG